VYRRAQSAIPRRGVTVRAILPRSRGGTLRRMSQAQQNPERRPPKLIWIVVGIGAVFGGLYVADALGIGGPSACTSKTFKQLDPGQHCAIQGEVLPLPEGQRELGTLQQASVFGEGKTYNQFNLRDEAGMVTIHFVAAEVLLPPTGRRVRVDVQITEVVAGRNVLVAGDWDFVE
jgi:hypothetical protein